jgi:cell division protein FtsQ
LWGSLNTPSAEPTTKSLPKPSSNEGPSASRRLEPRRRVPRWGAAVLAAGVLAAGGAGVVASPVFHARTIEVSGTSHLGRTEILRLAGLAPGTNVLWLDAGAAARRLETSRWIESASVSRSLPSTVRITVTERTPAAEVKVGSRWALVAADGTVLDRVSGDPGLPLLDTAMGNRRHLGPSASVIGAMTPWVRSRVRSVAAEGDGSLVVELSSGVRVLFGDPSDISVKDQALAGILRWLSSSQAPVGYIDLRAPLAPAVGSGTGPSASPKAGKASTSPSQ